MPNFLVIGAMKAGTTSLAQYLRAHPHIFMPEVKELYFFTEEHNWGRGPAWYADQFAGAGDALAVGEATVGYSMHPRFGGVPERMASLIPDARLVYLVRQPIERMISQYRHHAWHRWETLPVERALRENPVYLDASRYAMQVERYLPSFPLERILVVKSEDLRDDRQATLRKVFEFLGVDASVPIPSAEREFHATEGKRRIKPAARSLERLPGYRTAARMAPFGLKRLVYRLKTERIPPPPEVPAWLIQDLRERIHEDVVRLRTYVRDPAFDGWGLDAHMPSPEPRSATAEGSPWPST